MSSAANLSQCALRLSPRDHLTVADLMAHIFITGGTGSSKTTGSARHLREIILRSGAGACIACVKPGEAAMWEAEARRFGRGASIVRFGPQGTGFDLMRWALAEHRDDMEPLIHLLMQAVEFAERSSGGGDEGDQKFWKRAAHSLLSHCLTALSSGCGDQFDLEDIQLFIDGLPETVEEWSDPAWREHSLAWHVLTLCAERPVRPLEADRLTLLMHYFRYTYLRLGSRTRSSITLTLQTLLAPLTAGPLKPLFSPKRSTVLPELSHHGALILLDLPIKSHHEAGRLAQQLFIYCWMRATEKRRVTRSTVPVYLYADEFQFVANSYWHEFLSTARSSRAGCVMITQNKPTLIDEIGGRHADATVDALLGHAQTVIAHSNPCSVTNQWVAERIGRASQLRQSWNDGEQRGINGGENASRGTTTSDGSNWSRGEMVSRSQSFGSSFSSGTNSAASLGAQSGHSVQEVVDYEVQPGEFAALRRGGPRYGMRADAIVYSGGRRFAHTRRPWIKVTFAQR